MSTKSASSHAAAVLLCTVAGAFLIEALRPSLNGLFRAVGHLSAWLISLLGIPLRRDTLTVILVSSALAFVWGIGYHHVRERRGAG